MSKKLVQEFGWFALTSGELWNAFGAFYVWAGDCRSLIEANLL